MNYLHTHWIVSLACTLFLGLLAMVLHEMGHLATSWIVGVRVKSIGLCARGMYVVREAGTPAKNLLVSLAGPFTNVALFLMFLHISPSFTLANLCLAICNLAPVKGSDGDRALACLTQLQKEFAPAVNGD